MEEKKYRVYLCGGPHCTPRGRGALARELDDALWACKLDSDVDVRISGCQNRCNYGPNMTVWPGPVRYSGLTPAAIRRIVAEHLRDGVPVAEWLYAPEG